MARRLKNPEPPSSKGSKEKNLGLKQEVVGILLLALALYIGLSLASDSSGTNWGGVIGRHLASGLNSVIGYTSYVFPFLIAAMGLKCLLRRVLKISGSVPLGLGVFIPAFSAILTVLVTSSPLPGGVIGAMLSSLLMKYLGYTGSLILLFAVLLASVLLVTGTSLIGAVVRFFSVSVFSLRALYSVGLRLKSAAAGLRERRKARAGEVKAPKAPKVPKTPREPAIISHERHTPEPVAAAEELPAPAPAKAVPAESSSGAEAARLEFTSPEGSFTIPPTSLLDPVPESHNEIDKDTILENSKILERKLADFGVEGRVLEVRPGPVVTMYEFEPAPGIKVGRITSLADDLALAMKAMSIRIIAPIPGKSVVGIEIPNSDRGRILLREILECSAYAKSSSPLSLALGKDIAGVPYITDFAKMPHLLMAGATGTGKSVSVNAIIQSILFKATPEDVRFLMIDPKMLELSAYEGIPHLITPVITEPKRASIALKSIVAEMSNRYKLMSMVGTKNIDRYNRLVAGGSLNAEEAAEDTAEDVAEDMDRDIPEDMLEEAVVEATIEEEVVHQKLPYIVVIIDELADLMMTSGKDVEESLVRLSQMARAAGIHLLVATQRPSVDVVTGLIKTNFPARIAFQLPSRIDSRTILDTSGAETLLGDGDMLFLPPGTAKLQRVHGVYVSETEILRVADFWKNQGTPVYDKVITEETTSDIFEDEEDLGEEFLKRYDEAVALATSLEMISTSYIQRRFRIGYNTAARLIERMEKEGIVGPPQGSRPREVLKRVVE